MTGMPIGILVRQALQKPDHQIVGAPGWMDTERYSISAKAPDGTPPSARTVMMVNLLKERFQLAMHLETRERPIFHLVTARTDGRLGPDLKATPAECQATIAERIAAAKAAAGRGGPPPLPQFDRNGPLPCGSWRLAPGIAAGSGRTIAELVPTLADLVGRPVIDRTGLTGLYGSHSSLRPRAEARAHSPCSPRRRARKLRPSTPMPPASPLRCRSSSG